MQNNENKDLVSNPVNNKTIINQNPYPQTVGKTVMQYQLVYPEIYYKLQPYILMVCDEMDFDYIMPDMETVQRMSDNIYDDVCKMYPDMAEYAQAIETELKVDSSYNDNIDISRFERDYDRYRRDSGRYRRDSGRYRFRRRGVFRDLIDILLYSELFGRRRRYY